MSVIARRWGVKPPSVSEWSNHETFPPPHPDIVGVKVWEWEAVAKWRIDKDFGKRF